MNLQSEEGFGRDVENIWPYARECGGGRISYPPISVRISSCSKNLSLKIRVSPVDIVWLVWRLACCACGSEHAARTKLNDWIARAVGTAQECREG